MKNQPLNHANYKYLAPKIRGEINTLPSLTVPDQAMSIAEILNRFVKKLPLDVLPGVYTDDDFLPAEIERMDAIERKQYAMDMKKAGYTRKELEKREKPKLAPHPRATPEPSPDTEM